ncbi:MAG TPA: hypothetical protein VHY22_16465 [Chthoniobacteraceae bacterium]|nr:hypothetical protein [Chthoniobacteraceae bacterium]
MIHLVKRSTIIRTHCRAVLSLFLTIAAPLGTMAGIEHLGEWSAQSAVTLPAKGGSVQATIQYIKFAWQHSPSQWLERRSVTAITIPGIKLYWLGYGGLLAPNERKFFLFNNQIVGVCTMPNDVLVFYPSAEHLKSSDSTEEVHAIFRQKLDALENRDLDVKDIRIGMEGILGSFPFTGVPSAAGEPAPSINEINVGDNAFTIELAGGPGNAVPATITFDVSFKPLKATLLGKQVFPK